MNKNEYSSLRPTDMKCEYLVNPIGIDIERPRLSWKLIADEPSQYQTAYCLYASSSIELLENKEFDLWNSGIVYSKESLNICYQGKTLSGGKRCYWQVCVWDKDKQKSGLSEIAWFEMGILDHDDWKADWITGSGKSVLFRRQFEISKPVEAARLYICGQGVYKSYINGNGLNEVFGPALSFFPERMLYDTFDITDKISIGKNAVAAWVSPGWFGDLSTLTDKTLPEGFRNYTNHPNMLISQLVLKYMDGLEETIYTDENWKTMESPLEPVYSYWKYCYGCSGEIYDARKENPNWNSISCDESGWQSVSIASPPTKILSSNMMEANRIKDEVIPVNIEEIRENIDKEEIMNVLVKYLKQNDGGGIEYKTFYPQYKAFTFSAIDRCGGKFTGGRIYDLGRHVSGLVEVIVNGKHGDWVSLFGLDFHCLNGIENERVCINFAHRVIRFIPVLFFGAGPKPEIMQIRALEIDNGIKSTGGFSCSDPELTHLCKVIKNTWGALLLSGMPMDSWQEQLGTGFPNNLEQSVYNWDVAAFQTKWTMDYRDQQREDGYFPMTGAPIAFDYWSPPAGKNCSLIAAWFQYLYYGDTDILKVNYESIKKWLKLNIPEDYNGRTWQAPKDHGQAEVGFGDHGRPNIRWYDEHTGDLFETLFMVDCFRMAENIAGILGKDDDAKQYAEVLIDLINKCNREDFFDSDKGSYGNGDQGCQAMAVFLDIAPHQLRSKVEANLIKIIMDDCNGHLKTGFMGTYYLLKALQKLNRPDVAFGIITNKTAPSAYTMLNQHPASPQMLTIMPEFWTGGMIPHPGFCGIGSWFYQSPGGIYPDIKKPGFERILIKPQVNLPLEWADTEYESVRGLIKSGWKRKNDILNIHVSIPANTEAVVEIPGKSARLVKPEGVNIRGIESEHFTEYTITAGDYEFESIYKYDISK